MRKNARRIYPPNQKIPNTRLTPIAVSRTHPANAFAYMCVCECGSKKSIRHSDIATGRTKSCGCFGLEQTIKRSKTHGLSETPEYHAAFNAFSRCYKNKNKFYKHYGGRGIRVSFQNYCEMAKWLIKFLPKPDGRYCLDRIDNNGNYSKDNLRWITQRESNRNMTTSKPITIMGVTKLLCDWNRQCGVRGSTITHRIKRGVPECLWLHPKALTKSDFAKVEYGQLDASY